MVTNILSTEHTVILKDTVHTHLGPIEINLKISMKIAFIYNVNVLFFNFTYFI
jgi:hypothetical protein